MYGKGIRVFIVGVMVVSLAGMACGATRNWTNGAGGNAWDNPDNWDNSWGAGDNLNVDLADGPIISAILAPGFEETRRLRVGQAEGAVGNLTITGGILNLGNQVHTFGRENNATGTLTMSGGVLNSIDRIDFGDGGDGGAELGTGHLIFSGGQINIGPEGSNDRDLRIGANGAGSQGTGLISGGEINTSNDFRVGWGGGDREGTATMLGGVINTGRHFQVGGAGNSGSNTFGEFIMSGGTITTGVQSLRADPEADLDGHFDIGNGLATATWEMTGGTLNIDGAVRVGRGGSTGTGTISDGVITAGGLQVGNGNNTQTIEEVEVVTPSSGLLEVTGGTLTVGEVRLGRNQGAGELRVSGGSISVPNNDVLVGSTNVVYDELGETILELQPGPGTLIMTGGSFAIGDPNSLLVGTDMDVAMGMVDLLGGVLSAGDMDIREGSVVNIELGTLILAGDKTAKVQAFVDAGTLTAYGSDGMIVYDFDVTNVGKTTVTAIPEPATLFLLGLGGLVQLRRRRKK